MPSWQISMRLPPSVDPVDVSGEGVADLIELGMLIGGSRSMSHQALIEALRDQRGLLPPVVEMGLNLMSRRRQILGPERYPYDPGSVGVRAAADAASRPYSALLALSGLRQGVRQSAAQLSTAAAVLERLTCEAACGLLGDGAQALRFGWPSEEGRPSDFPAAVRWLADRLQLTVGAGYRPPRRQDGGVDVVAWRPFPDGQPGFPLLLVQCTLERDFVHKSADIDLRLWSTWLGFDNEPATALAIPHVVSKAEDWREMSARVLVLDRLRLAGLLEVHDSGARDWLASALAAAREEH